MRCINKKKAIGCFSLVCMTVLSGCGSLKYDFAYDPDYAVSSFQLNNVQESERGTSFAEKLCIVAEDVNLESLDLSDVGAACLFDVNQKETLYSKSAHERMYPASLTKVMTALVAIKNGTKDQILTATENVKISESGAQLMNLKAGDTMTLDQALHILLIYSANDVANLIAESIGGSINGFVEMMNAEALSLGATNTNFANPHGLSDESHYTTAYDLYLIFNEAMKYEEFNEIIQMSSYSTVYYDSNNNSKEFSKETTNRFLRGTAEAPSQITVIGGKTGTTNAAGHCLVLLSRDTSGAPYISLILKAESTDLLYEEMSDLLGEIQK